MAKSPPPIRGTQPQDSPVVWFSELLIAHDQGDYDQAVKAQRQLDRLGWRVCRAQNRGLERQEATACR
jgi:hypothetical protein